MNHASNPFTNRGMIMKPDEFFGREEHLQNILVRLKNMQSTSIVGDRRIGKSSLLYHLTQTGANRLNDANLRIFYLDLEAAYFHTANGFFRTVLKKLDLSPDVITDEKSLNHNLTVFTDEIESLTRTGQRIILCLDEFENTFKHSEHFNEDFFDHMRAQLNMRAFAFVTATRRPLMDLSLEGNLTSPFYNIFTTIELKEFTDEEARYFVDNNYQNGNITEDERKFILSFLDPHPLRLQIICDCVIRNRQMKLAEWALIEEITKEFAKYFVGRYDRKQWRRAKRVRHWFSLEKIKSILDILKNGRDLIKPSGKE